MLIAHIPIFKFYAFGKFNIHSIDVVLRVNHSAVLLQPMHIPDFLELLLCGRLYGCECPPLRLLIISDVM